MSTVDNRVRVGIALDPPTDVAAWLNQGAAFDAAGADALWVHVPDEQDEEVDPHVLAAALAAVTYRCQLVLSSPAGSERTLRTLNQVSRGRVAPVDEAQVWETVEVPAGRSAWKQALAEAAERGAHGVVVPADPRLLDLLRNPDEEIDRSDLLLSSG